MMLIFDLEFKAVLQNFLKAHYSSFIIYELFNLLFSFSLPSWLWISLCTLISLLKEQDLPNTAKVSRIIKFLHQNWFVFLEIAFSTNFVSFSLPFLILSFFLSWSPDSFLKFDFTLFTLENLRRQTLTKSLMIPLHEEYLALS